MWSVGDGEFYSLTLILTELGVHLQEKVPLCRAFHGLLIN